MSGFQPADDKLSFDSFLFENEHNSTPDSHDYFFKKKVPSEAFLNGVTVVY